MSEKCPTIHLNQPTASIAWLHKLAERGQANGYRGTDKRIVEFIITEDERVRWPLLKDAEKVWLIYE